MAKNPTAYRTPEALAGAFHLGERFVEAADRRVAVALHQVGGGEHRQIGRMEQGRSGSVHHRDAVANEHRKAVEEAARRIKFT